MGEGCQHQVPCWLCLPAGCPLLPRELPVGTTKAPKKAEQCSRSHRTSGESQAVDSRKIRQRLSASKHGQRHVVLADCQRFSPGVCVSLWMKVGIAVDCMNCRQKLLSRHGRGCAFTLSVQRQSNVVVVVTRGINAEAIRHSAVDLQDAADQTGLAAGYLFECGSRACRGLTII